MSSLALIFHRFRRYTAALLAFVLLLTGAATVGTPSANAYVPTDGIWHVWMNLADSGSQSQQSQYQSLINSLRQATSNNNSTWRGGTYATQDTAAGLIMLTLTIASSNTTVTLWIDPANLYVMGFSNRWNQTWQFNDQTALSARLARTSFQMNGGYAMTLPFGGSYGSITGSSGNDRSNMGLSYADIIGSVNQLANVQSPYGGPAPSGSAQQWTARSLLLMISFTSEAARFYDVTGVFRTTMVGTNQAPGLNTYIQELENDWGGSSQYGRDVTNNPSTPEHVVAYNPIDIRFTNFWQFAAAVAVLLLRQTAINQGSQQF